VVRGRVLAVESPDRLSVLTSGAEPVRSVSVGAHDAKPGDLVEIDGDGRVRVVFRPRVEAFGAESEPTRFALHRGIERLRQRAQIVRSVRAFFLEQRGFELEVETPSIVTCPGLDVHLHGFEVRRPDGEHEGYLITSPECAMKRLLVGGVSRCFQFARCFRAGERGSRHEPEFTMLEWYRAWGDLDALRDDTFGVLCAAAEAVGANLVRVGDHYERITVREAFRAFAPDAGDPIELAERDEAEYFRVLSERVEPQLGRDRPTFLERFPARHASLAKLCDDDPSVCERVELYVGGVELSNGFVELTDPVEQRARFERDQRERAARGLPVYPIDERFLAALEQGMPPAVGNALGFDRLVMLVTGAGAIDEVMAFPVRRR
jgi:lysyl-tRNA synthetase class 2